jgi:hypothetical protein
MPQVKLAAKFTKDQQPYNGLTDDKHVAELIDQPHERRYALVAYDVRRITEEIEDGTEVPTVNLVHIEPLTGERAVKAKAEMKEMFHERTGRSDEPDPGLFETDVDGNPVVPEPDGEELLAEHREAKAAEAGGS